MTEKRKSPALRFRGYTDDWEQCKLGDVVQITMGQSPDGSTYSDEPSDYILVQGNADLQNGWVCPRIWTTQITKKADAGDLIMSVRAPAGAMGKTAYNAVIGRGVAAIKGNEFIYQLLVKMDADGFWKTLSCGSTFESLNSDNIRNVEVKIPTTPEQIKIGGYFQHLDHLITLHQRKLEKLKMVKKSMLEKMFPKNGSSVPEIRFNGFTDDWEQRKVGETVTEVSRPIELNDYQEYQLVTVKRRNEGIVPRGRMYGKNILVKNYFEIHAGDYLISKRQLVHGANGIVPENLDKAVVSNEYMACVSNEFVTAEFLTLLSKTKSLLRDFFLSSYGVDIEKLVFDVEDWEKRSIIIPKIEEQNKICEYFSYLDSLITLHQRKVEKLQIMKKSMLEKMFV